MDRDIAESKFRLYAFHRLEGILFRNRQFQTGLRPVDRFPDENKTIDPFPRFERKFVFQFRQFFPVQPCFAEVVRRTEELIAFALFRRLKVESNELISFFLFEEFASLIDPFFIRAEGIENIAFDSLTVRLFPPDFHGFCSDGFQFFRGRKVLPAVHP